MTTPYKYITVDERKSMTEEELHQLSLEKNKKGNYTSMAKQAQEELCRRHGTIGGMIHTPWHLSDER